MKTETNTEKAKSADSCKPNDTRPSDARPRSKSTRRWNNNKPEHGGCHETNRRAAIVLEVLAGVRTPGQAAKALRLSVNYYYVLERKALAGLVAACRPMPKGPTGPTLERQLENLQRQLDQCRNECQRQAALVRATQRAVGLPAPAAQTSAKKSAAKKGGGSKAKTRRRRRPTVRALRAADSLRAQNSSLENSLEGIKQDGMQQGELATTTPSSALPSSTQDQET